MAKLSCEVILSFYFMTYTALTDAELDWSVAICEKIRLKIVRKQNKLLKKI